LAPAALVRIGAVLRARLPGWHILARPHVALDNATILEPDLVVVSAERLAQTDPTAPDVTVVPDLVIDLIGPRRDSAAYLVRKAAYRHAKGSVVWHVDLLERSVAVEAPMADPRSRLVIDEAHMLDLPDGTTLAASELFA
jgi:hypothetical protein